VFLIFICHCKLNSDLDIFKISLRNDSDAIWLEKDVFIDLAGTDEAKVFVTEKWWSQIKVIALETAVLDFVTIDFHLAFIFTDSRLSNLC